MNTSIDLSFSTRFAPAQATRLQRVLNVTLADWQNPLVIRSPLLDEESARPPRRSSFLSRSSRASTTRMGR